MFKRFKKSIFIMPLFALLIAILLPIENSHSLTFLSGPLLSSGMGSKADKPKVLSVTIAKYLNLWLQELSKSGINIINCEFKNNLSEVLVATDDIQSCLAHKLNHDLYFLEYGELRLEVQNSQGYKSWADVEWDHLKIGDYKRGKGRFEKLRRKFSGINISKVLKQALNHDIIMTLEVPLTIKVQSINLPLLKKVEQIHLNIEYDTDKEITTGLLNIYDYQSVKKIKMKTNFSIKVVINNYLSKWRIFSRLLTTKEIKSYLDFETIKSTQNTQIINNELNGDD